MLRPAAVDADQHPCRMPLGWGAAGANTRNGKFGVGHTYVRAVSPPSARRSSRPATTPRPASAAITR